MSRGGRLAGDNLRLGHSSHSGGAKSQPTHRSSKAPGQHWLWELSRGCGLKALGLGTVWRTRMPKGGPQPFAQEREAGGRSLDLRHGCFLWLWLFPMEPLPLSGMGQNQLRMLVFHAPHGPTPPGPEAVAHNALPALSPCCSLPRGGLVPSGRCWPGSQDFWLEGLPSPWPHDQALHSPAAAQGAAGQQWRG